MGEFSACGHRRGKDRGLTEPHPRGLQAVARLEVAGRDLDVRARLPCNALDTGARAHARQIEPPSEPRRLSRRVPTYITHPNSQTWHAQCRPAHRSLIVVENRITLRANALIPQIRVGRGLTCGRASDWYLLASRTPKAGSKPAVGVSERRTEECRTSHFYK